jgi:hypothetical protein
MRRIPSAWLVIRNFRNKIERRPFNETREVYESLLRTLFFGVHLLNPLKPKPVSQGVRLNFNSVNQLIVVMVKNGVLFEVRTEFLNII